MSVTPGRLLTILIGVAMLAVAGCTSTLSIGTASKHHLSKQHSKQHHKKSHRSQHAHGHPKHHSHAHSRHHAKHHSHKSGHAAPAQDTLVVEPNAGFGTVYSLTRRR